MNSLIDLFFLFSFDCKVRRESTNLQDMFIAHIGAMDCFALALRKMARLFEDKKYDWMPSRDAQLISLSYYASTMLS